MSKEPQGRKRPANAVRNAITVSAVKELGGGNFQVSLRVGNRDTQISHTDIVCAEGCDAAIELVKHDFTHWLEMAFALAAKGVKPSP